MRNQSAPLEFVLTDFADSPILQSICFIVFLIIYLIGSIGNFSIILVYKLDMNLHTPMYFFLSNLSFLDICYATTTMPEMLQILLAERKSISLNSCIFQMYFFVAFVGTESLLLAVMAYDRYVAICFPLRYTKTMNRTSCFVLVIAAWISGLCNSLVHTTLTFHLPFCGSHQLNHYFCDIPPLLEISCMKTYVNELVLFIVGGIAVGFSPFIFIFVSYSLIISTIFRMPSVIGKKKAFSTCGSHLTVVLLFYGTAIFTYIRPSSTYSLKRDNIVSVLYSVVTPLLNPIIYSLRNKEIKRAVGLWITVEGEEKPKLRSTKWWFKNV
uniref:Olfactory receptor n=1 Tax=Leptobrachium leishanense TaxID=445787 RepID=A0A8C5QMK2_9ANUR